MNLVKWKSFIRENSILNAVAECYLQARTVIRYVTKGSYSQYAEDTYVKEIFLGGGKSVGDSLR